MNTRTATEIRVKAITANLEALHALLTAAVKRSQEGYELIQNGECNGAIGTLLGLDAILEDANALYGAALALHRLK